MAEGVGLSGFGDFLTRIGVYDVVLPFILIFTIVFAILEKTKILGVETINEVEYTKKNINSMVAFSIAFLVVASTQLVGIINTVISQVALLLILGICFLMLVGSFFGSKEFTLEDYPKWVSFLMIFMFIGIVLIFLNALDWLRFVIYFFSQIETQWVAAVIFMLVIIGFMYLITKDPKPKKAEESK
tara:strand:- start:16 stop:573 length:558 start_codon:yes stop_codon:yes gene_type:complete